MGMPGLRDRIETFLLKSCSLPIGRGFTKLTSSELKTIVLNISKEKAGRVVLYPT